MKSLAKFLVAMASVAACSGCGHEPTRDPDVDAKGPIVNALAPGARSGVKEGAAISGGLYKAPPNTKTGIPK